MLLTRTRLLTSTHKSSQYSLALLLSLAHFAQCFAVNSTNLTTLPDLAPSATICPDTMITRGNPWPLIQPQIQNAVVQIFAQVAEFNWLQPYAIANQTITSGSGFFINDQGMLITNAHVINQAKLLTCQIPSLGKEQFELEIVGVSFDRDIALLKLKNIDEVRTALGGKIPYLLLGDSDAISRGEEIMAVGFPLGQQFLKTTVGIISGYESFGGRQYIQIDAPINPGNSGGPAVNANAHVIGINTAGVPSAQNVGYIIPVRELQMVIKDLCEAPNKLLRRPYLGVWYSSATKEVASFFGNPPTGGCLIFDVAKNGLLDRAGIQAYDMIYEVNGLKLDFFGDIALPGKMDHISLLDYVSYLTLGSELQFVVYRKGQRLEINTKLEVVSLPAIRAMYPDFEPIDYEIIGGFVIMPLALNHVPLLVQKVPGLLKYDKPQEQNEPVLVISHILPASAAQSSRIFVAGNSLKEINGVAVKTLTEFRVALQKSLTSGVFTIKTENDVFSVFSLAKLLADEPKLAMVAHYTITPAIRDLMQQFDLQQLATSTKVAKKKK